MAAPKGDFRALQKIIASTGRIASEELTRNSVRTFGRVSHDLALEGASAGRNPQGRAWKQLKKNGGRALRWMAATLKLRIRNGRGFEIKSSSDIANYQQHGWKRQTMKKKTPARRVLPKRALPKPWRDRIVPALENEWYSITK